MSRSSSSSSAAAWKPYTLELLIIAFFGLVVAASGIVLTVVLPKTFPTWVPVTASLLTRDMLANYMWLLSNLLLLVSALADFLCFAPVWLFAALVYCAATFAGVTVDVIQQYDPVPISRIVTAANLLLVVAIVRMVIILWRHLRDDWRKGGETTPIMQSGLNTYGAV